MILFRMALGSLGIHYLARMEESAVARGSESSDDFSFTVDTHLFRELGQYLVGRNSTALIEMVKNAYDADATELIVSGEELRSAGSGSITLVDNGTGMSPESFQLGFLRIASRTKTEGDRRSAVFGRRLTGAKGVGRLAAHKLARELHVLSTPSEGSMGVEATLDWDAVEERETLEDLDGIPVVREVPRSGSSHGTTIELVRLRERWTKPELDRFLLEVSSFQPPSALVDPLPASVLEEPMLFESPAVRSSTVDDPGFSVVLDGEFETGDVFWPRLADIASWVLEIDATPDLIRFAVGPTVRTREEIPAAERRVFEHVHSSPDVLPAFQARVIVREGRIDLPQKTVAANSGVRVYVEGFRVLPYGDPGDDWLSLNQDATGRTPAGLRRLRESGIASGDQSKREELSIYSNLNYHGAVFLADQSESELTMLVNREGFIPDEAFEALRDVTRLGIDVTTRMRARYRESIREERRKRRAGSAPGGGGTKPSEPRAPSDQLREAVREASASIAAAVDGLASGNDREVTQSLERASRAIQEVEAVEADAVSEAAMLRVLASVGLQMAAVVHELTAVAAGAGHLVDSARALVDSPGLDDEARRQLAPVVASARDLQHAIDRQAAYLTDLVSADAKRRRARQNLAAAFDSAVLLVDRAAQAEDTTIRNEIPSDLRSPPMFKSEIVSVFTNLLTNAVKAAGPGGEVVASGRMTGRSCEITVQNSGAAVDLADGERWFEAFETTTAAARPLRGQGMGLGLTITRRMLESYRGSIQFVEPDGRFATAVMIRWPR